MALTSPGVVYRDLLIVGGRVSEGLPASPGDVRAYDVRTGALQWSFHTIPHPGEFGHETWSTESWRDNGGANNWPGMALDEARGHRLRADRIGRVGLLRRQSASATTSSRTPCVALDAATGTRLWHYQFVRHDIWDRDLPSPPTPDHGPARRPHDRRGRAGHQARATCSSSIA